ncbi:ABC transporter permease [Streptomyces sp. J2-1]|uniref:ABC transporter permease n=1 Tax=Streptomyces corallincola TaxID=2851888 RepID=UPI001C383EF9|nr:ABC transporter permease [Streptomyces corallincola]MBV2357236.1 ABC transporter permease [Streptomyces corallincola]
MSFAPALHAEWIKLRSLRALTAALAAIVVATTTFSILFAASPDDSGASDPLFTSFFGVSFGQIAAIAFGTTALSSDLRPGALGLAFAAMPDRRRWFAAKAAMVALPVLGTGLLTGVVTLLACRAVQGASAPTWAEDLRGVVGCGVQLTLTALFATGLTALLRSGVATLSLLIPFLLVLSFVVGDLSSGIADLLPDRAGQIALHSTWDGSLGPWSGLAVSAAWTGAALLVGGWRLNRRDA